MSLNFEHSFELRMEILRIFVLMTRYIENVYNICRDITYVRHMHVHITDISRECL